MHKLIYFILLLSFTACVKNECVKDIPVCIENKIKELKAKPKGMASSEVYEYNYRGKRVFHFVAYCCDVYGELLDENCNYICAPDGGITGGGNGACTDFFSLANNKRLVWKDER